MIASSTPSCLARWDARFGKRRRNRTPPRPFGALGYLANGPVVDGLAEIENLVLVAVYDEPQESGKLALRLAGFAGRRVPWGVQWGGQDGNLFFKDLLLRPSRQARGRRLDAACESLLALALKLDRQLERHARYPRPARPQPLRLPRLWAGFRASQVAHITGDGPELARIGRSADDLLAESRRSHEGLVLYPLEWVSHQWPRMAAVFADLATYSRWQVFPLHDIPADLQGHQAAAEFDFYHSRFRRPVVSAELMARVANPVAV